MISIIVPTRNRPKEFRRMCDTIVETQRNKNEVVAYIDGDDGSFKDYPSYNAYDGKLRIAYVVGPRIILTDCWNKCIPKASGEIFCQGNDDIVFKTPDWDVAVENAFAACPDKILLVHGSDEGQHFNKFAAHGFVHKRWIDTIGYFIPPYFSSDYGDNWLNDLANACGRRQFIPIKIEHLHFLFKKAPMDETYRERLARHAHDNPGGLYYSKEMTMKRWEDINKLKAIIGQQAFSVVQNNISVPLPKEVVPLEIMPKCPKCKSSAVGRSQGRFRCNQCGHQFAE